MADAHGRLRLLEDRDLTEACELSEAEHWNQTVTDWRMMRQLAPDGCFAIEVDGRLAATVTLMCYGEDLAWVGMVLTHREYRRRGFARRLLETVLHRADTVGIPTVKLDATEQGQPLYESLGFRVEQPIERWTREASSGPTLVSKGNLPPIDRLAFGAERSALLKALVNRGACLSTANGYALSRPGKFASYLGPCVSSSPEDARHLISAHLQAASPNGWYWDLLPENQAAGDLAQANGFTRQRRLVRMVRGRDLRAQENCLFAIAGFEFG